MNFIRKILNLLLPASCIVCRKAPDLLCGTCISKLELSPRITTENNFIDSVFAYKDPRVKSLIWQLKYKNAISIADIFGLSLYNTLIPLLDELTHYKGVTTLYLLPIPLHHQRLRERGYNQSLLLAQALLAHDTTSSLRIQTDLLYRSKTSIPNARTHSKKERLQNIKSSFTINNRMNYLGKTILLVDDVFTTGATLSEARKTLLKAGAHEVYAITLAH